jgi:large subunit ribosomal protein L24e
MVGKKERELARARKLVAENEHLLPRMRGSELKKLREAAAEGAMEIDEEELLQDARNVKRKSQVFGGEARKIKVRIDDGVEEDAME